MARSGRFSLAWLVILTFELHESAEGYEPIVTLDNQRGWYGIPSIFD